MRLNLNIRFLNFILPVSVLLLVLVPLKPQVGFAKPTHYENYEKAKVLLEKAPQDIQAIMKKAPVLYAFPSRFDGEDSVSFTGQTFRHLLTHDLNAFMRSLFRGKYPTKYRKRLLKDPLNAFYSYIKFNSNASPAQSHISYGFITGLHSYQLKVLGVDGMEWPVTEGNTYNAIQFPGKNLAAKIAGNDNPLRHKELKGWNGEYFHDMSLADVNADRKEDLFIEPEDFLRAILQVVAQNATTESESSLVISNGALDPQTIDNANLTRDGLNLRELAYTFLQGALVLSQAAGDYLSTDLGNKKGLNANNTAPYKGRENHTALEHHWDEAFGYFGVARDFLNYSDREMAQGLSKDTDGDGSISLLREKNMNPIVASFARIRLQFLTSANTGINTGTGTNINTGTNTGTDINTGTNTENNTCGRENLPREAVKSFLIGRELISQQPADYLKYAKAHALIAVGAWEKILTTLVIQSLNATLKMMESYGTKNYLFTSYAQNWSQMKGYAMAFQFNPNSFLNSTDFEKLHWLIGDKPLPVTDLSSSEKTHEYKENLSKARELLKSVFGVCH